MALKDRGNVKPGCSAPAAAAAATATVLASEAILSFSSSASWSLLALARRFWNQILTWVSVRVKEDENSALSAMDRYCFCLNFLSRASSCDVVKGVRGFRLVLCFRNWQPGLIWPEEWNGWDLIRVQYVGCVVFVCSYPENHFDLMWILKTQKIFLVHHWQPRQFVSPSQTHTQILNPARFSTAWLNRQLWGISTQKVKF